jgi:hypothetical protein
LNILWLFTYNSLYPHLGGVSRWVWAVADGCRRDKRNILASHFIHQFLVNSSAMSCRVGQVMGRRL